MIGIACNFYFVNLLYYSQ